MKQITKTVQEIGNGGHIYLPKELVGNKVVITLVEKTIEDIEEELLNILKPHLKQIQGIYLHGSYARNEQTPESDIDVLVVTDAKIKKRINEYEIISATEEQLKNTIKNNAVLILPILKESRTILNQQLIEKYKKERLTKKNTKWYIETTESSLKLAQYIIPDRGDLPIIVYPLIMRLRGLYLIESLIYDKTYSNKELINYLIENGISKDKVEQLYRMYREHRDGRTISKNLINQEDIQKLYNIVQRYFKKVKTLWEKLK